jgi:hypothetical protein
MLGDAPPPPALGIPPLAPGQRPNPGFPPFPGQVQGAVLLPSVRGFKIADDNSPQPRDRVYFDFNYFDELNESLNRRLDADFHNFRVYRETLGAEKTFLDRDASIELRLPINTLDSDSRVPGVGGDTSTDIGDLSVVLKGVLWRNTVTGSLISTGLAVTAPSGADTFAGSSTVRTFHETTLQPFVGYLWNDDRLFIHGFTAVDVPTDSRDVTILYNDIGVGYFVYRNRDCDRFLTAIVPTFEVHVDTPLNHRGALNFADPAGTPDVVDLTLGATFEFKKRGFLAIGVVTPVTGPRPFDVEALVQFNLLFGPTTSETGLLR